MLKRRFVLGLVLAACLLGIPGLPGGGTTAPAQAGPPPNALVCQIAAVNLAKGYIDVHPGYTVVLPTTYRYHINRQTKVINGTLATLRPGLTVSIQAKNGVALTIQVIGFVQ